MVIQWSELLTASDLSYPLQEAVGINLGARMVLNFVEAMGNPVSEAQAGHLPGLPCRWAVPSLMPRHMWVHTFCGSQLR